jgi:2-polyprenyl-6-methoxyphenol hydroxylase-like FAD-dependent oxidoreductase
VQNDVGVEIYYDSADGSMRKIQTIWLIGADGKRGVVRKSFLEPLADIRQVDSSYQYTGTWVAANLHINLPTPETHPDFPPFASGLTPQEVYDLFWPKGWHFCSPPGKPTASGRFGPHDKRLWRHEFAQENIEEESLDVEDLFWEHITPMMTRDDDAKGNKFSAPATWPKDMITILRCRPFTFTHKVVNLWFYKRTMLIGDAAHVFPPFGGQGIASGIRDAHQLAWRIALLESRPQTSERQVDEALGAWAAERTQSIKDAAYFTSINARMCNQGIPRFFNPIKIIEGFRRYVLGYTEPWDPQASIEKLGFSKVAEGFHLPQYKGGIKLPQVYLESLYESKLLSDSMFDGNDSILRLLVLVNGSVQMCWNKTRYQSLLKSFAIPETILSPVSTVFLSKVPAAPSSTGSSSGQHTRKFTPTPIEKLSHKQARRGYEPSAIRSRFGDDVQFIIVRPDFFAFAAAKDFTELKQCLMDLTSLLS